MIEIISAIIRDQTRSIGPAPVDSRFDDHGTNHVSGSPSGPVPVEAGLTTTIECRTLTLPIRPRAGGSGFDNYGSTARDLVSKPASTGAGPDGEPKSWILFGSYQTRFHRHRAGWGRLLSARSIRAPRVEQSIGRSDSSPRFVGSFTAQP